MSAASLGRIRAGLRCNAAPRLYTLAGTDWDYIEQIKQVFQPFGTEFYYVELVADSAVRMARNATENRLLHKPSKRDIALSNQRLLDADALYRLESLPGEIPFAHYMKIDNTNLEPDVVAQMIKTHFVL